MRHLQYQFFLLIFLAALRLNFNAAAQDTTKTNYETNLKVTAAVGAKEVPLNRELSLTVTVEWTGDIKRFEISELENPVVENFEILSTSATDRRLSEEGKNKAARIYEFKLKPKSLGMGYIESMIVKYIDNETGEGHSLITNRLNVKVIDPIHEPGSKSWLIKWIVLAGVIIAGLSGFLIWQSKIQEKKRKETEKIKVVPLEEEYLTMLKESLNLNSPDLKINEAFWILSRIIRKYLSQKYRIPSMESTTEKIVSDLSAFDLDQSTINNIQEILAASDVAKFAGSEGNRTELDRIYILTEAILQRNLAEAKATEQTVENK